jgi:F-type H+-transporting ATPase subunit a
MAHSAVDHVTDEGGHWTLFTDLFGGVSIPLPEFHILGYTFQLTKFMVVELIAAGLIAAIFIPLARRAARGGPPKGAFWNAFESLLTFIRNEVARPTLASPAGHHEGEHGHHDGEHGHHHPDDEVDRFVPFLWTIFLFVLFCNLLGLIPLMGSPTASIWVTGALALCSFVMMHAAAIAKMGFGHYLKSLWPAMDIPLIIAIFLKPMIFIIELFGTVIKGGVLAVRLFANMFAGHMVLATILFFIVQTANLGAALWGGVTVASVLGVTALSLLELFVAFLQAYIFTFLTALFMGMALNPQH